MTTLSGNWDSNSHRFLETFFAKDRTKQRATKYFALKRAVAMNTFYSLDEDAERDDDKIDDGLDERAVLDFGIPDFRAQLGEIDFSEGYADERHHS